MRSILSPIVAEKYFPELIYQYTTHIKTAVGESKSTFKADIKAFPEFNSSHVIQFVLFRFHSHFDGLIGLNDLRKMNFNIDLQNNELYNLTTRIPIHFNIKRNEFNISVNAMEISATKIPVSEYAGDIIIPEMRINGLHFPETLTTAENGFAKTEIRNNTNENICITFKNPIKVISFPDSKKDEFNFFHIENFMPNSEIKNKKEDITKLIRTNHLNTEEKKAIELLCKEYQDIFHQDDQKLTFTHQVQHEIKTTDEIPVHTRSYRYPFIHKEEVQRQISKMLEDGIIRPSQSPWSSPIWIVPKKQDASGKPKWRIVVDYRKVNEKTIEDRYPMPNITDILDKLGRCQYFSTLDLASGFHQIQMHPDSISKTAFTVENGHYEYVRMPFGLKNAPATFMRVMDSVLRDLQGKSCLLYVDDVIVYSTNLEEHIKNLKLVFQRLRDARMKVQPDKSEFLRKDVEFLGHVITPNGIKPNPQKIEAIRKFPIPKTSKQIKSFLGLLGYYRRFIKDFAKITKPFTNCLKKGMKIEHSEEFIRTFEHCKNLLMNEPILQFPDFTKPFILTTDASNFAIGAVLSQGKIGNDLPVAYASRTLNPAEANYSTIQKELLAIVWAVAHFRPYLFGVKFTIVTDHMPLRWLFNLKEPNSRLVRWRLKLEEYDYDICYKKGKQNTNADALSRIEINAFENESLIVNTGDLDDELENIIQNVTLTEQDRQELNDILPINNESDNETAHTSAENPILNIPITETPVNSYCNQIIFIQGKTKKFHTTTSKPFFTKNRITANLTENVEEETIDFFKYFVDPKKLYCLHFKETTFDLLPTLVTILQRTFKNNAYQLVCSNKFVTDLPEIDDQKEVIDHHHTTKTCHRGINETYEALKLKYYWPNMKNDITEFINNCEICQKAKYDRHPPKIKYNLTLTPNKPFESLHVDVFQVLQKKFLTIFDTFSKYGQAYPLEPNLSSISVLDCLSTFISHFGVPASITCDNGTEFKSRPLVDFCKLHKINLHYTTPRNSNSNSPVERFHSSLLENIRCLKLQNANSPIKQIVQLAVLGYNSSLHSVTKHRPFDIILGNTSALDPFDLTDENILNNYVIDRKERLEALYQTIHDKNLKAKTNVINTRNETREEPQNFEENQTIYVKNRQATRHKTNPRQLKDTVKEDLGLKIKTTKNQIVHKSKITKHRKTKKKNFLQGTSNNDPGPSRIVPSPNNDE